MVLNAVFFSPSTWKTALDAACSWKALRTDVIRKNCAGLSVNARFLFDVAGEIVTLVASLPETI